MLAALTTRRLSIAALETVPWGGHVCQVYEEDSDLIALLVPYLLAGLEHNECCIWITPDSLTVKQALRALLDATPACRAQLESGQLEVHPYAGWYSCNGRVDRAHLMQRLDDRLRAALNEGYDGLRMCGPALWLESRIDWEAFGEYEQALDRMLAGRRIVALMTYPLTRCSAADVLHLARHHDQVTIHSQDAYEILPAGRSRRQRNSDR